MTEIAATATRTLLQVMDLDLIRVLDWLQRGTRMSWLATRFFTGGTAQTFRFGFGIAVLGGRFAAVAAGDSQTLLKAYAVGNQTIQILRAQVA